MGLLARFREYDEIADISAIARRYFAMNAFDGVVTILGVLVGSFVAGVTSTRIVITMGLSTAAAMGVSGFMGAYLTESAERRRELDELSAQTLSDLSESRVARAARAAVWLVTIVDAGSPALSAALVLSPFFFASWFPSVQSVYFASFGAALVVLLALGVYLGGISGGRRTAYAARTVVAGAVAIAIGFGIERCGAG